MMNIQISTPEGSRDYYDTHLMCKHVYTGPKASTKPPSEPAAAAAKPSSFKMKKVNRKTFAGKSKEVEGPSTSSYNEGPFGTSFKEVARGLFSMCHACTASFS